SENGRKNLYVYENLGTKKIKLKVKRSIRGLDQIEDMDVSNDGSMLAVSADRSGRNDIYLVSVARGSALPLTSDLYDDFSPRFIQGSSRKLVFSSNRPAEFSDTIKADYKTINGPISIFEHDGTPKSGEIKVLLRGEGKTKSSPIYADADEVYYLSDSKGISNVFKIARNGSAPQQLTNYIHGIRSADIYPKSGGVLAFTYLNDGYYNAAVKNGFDTNASISAPDLKGNTSGIVQPGTSVAAKDSVAAKPVESVTPKLVLKDGEVDTDNYQFDEDVLKTFESRQRRGALSGTAGVLNRTRPIRENIAIKGPFPYKGLFITNDASSDWRVDPIRGFGYAQSLSMNDLLENHVIKAGFFVSSNFRNSDLFAEYNNNTYRIDFGVRIDRRALYSNAENYPQKYRFNQVTFSASYPFSPTSRFTLSPMFSSARLIDVFSLSIPDLNSNFGGLRSEYVFDNTKVNGMNMMEGTRFKLRFDMQAGLSSANESFNRLSLDFRHYQKIHRDLILAIRAAGSHSAGRA
ncbi:MAG TPA: hypothetical protein VGN64_23290, partial [Dyadobacter sp.]|nr:hypothetical protein [Dyadobacter sp.]